MTKKHEGLVEEVRLLWCEECADGPMNYEGLYSASEWDGTCEAEDLCRERAGKCITLILSAFRDGKVKVKCPECGEPIELLVCNRCHLEAIDGHIV